MKTNTLFITLLFFLITWFTAIKIAKSQDNTLYFLHSVPQSISLNPAIQYPCNKFIELPVLSSLKLALNNSSFGYNNLIKKGSGTQADSFVIDLNEFSSNFKKHNFVNAELGFTILGFGFRKDDYYFTFKIADKTIASFDYPKSFVMLKDGNWNSASNTPVVNDLSGTGIALINFMEFAVGASKQVDPFTFLGIKLKYLKGGLNITTKQSDILLTTTDFPITQVTLETDYKINTSMPLTITTDSTGMINQMQVNSSSLVKSILFNKNRGIAIDAGIIYSFADNWNLQASIIDLGFISWKQNTNNLNIKGNITYQGFELSKLIAGNQDIASTIQDTLRQAFKAGFTTSKYKSLLPVKLFTGVSYKFNDKIQAQGINKIMYFNRKFTSSTTLSVIAKPLKFIDISAGITYMNHSIANLSWALVIGKKGLQFYFVTEKLPIKYAKLAQSGAILPYSARSLNFQFGFNLLFGCKNKNSSKDYMCPAYR